MRFAYVYVMADRPEDVIAAAPRHAAYWHGLGLDGYMGGPFADRRGGLITFEAGDQLQAEQYVEADPFVLEGLVTERWVRAWEPRRAADEAVPAPR